MWRAYTRTEDWVDAVGIHEKMIRTADIRQASLGTMVAGTLNAPQSELSSSIWICNKELGLAPTRDARKVTIRSPLRMIVVFRKGSTLDAG